MKNAIRTAAIAAVDGERCADPWIVGVRVSHPVWALALHDALVITPILRPGPHQVIRPSMNRARPTALLERIATALCRRVGKDTLATFQCDLFQPRRRARIPSLHTTIRSRSRKRGFASNG